MTYTYACPNCGQKLEAEFLGLDITRLHGDPCACMLRRGIIWRSVDHVAQMAKNTLSGCLAGMWRRKGRRA